MVTRMKANLPCGTCLWSDLGPLAGFKHGDARPMSNLLTPDGLITKKAWVNDDQPGIDAATFPMPPYQTWIRTGKGVRILRLEELARGLGISKANLDSCNHRLSPTLLQRTTSIFHWEYLAPGLSRAESQVVLATSEGAIESTIQDTVTITSVAAPPPPFHWAPPSLGIGDLWYR